MCNGANNFKITRRKRGKHGGGARFFKNDVKVFVFKLCRFYNRIISGFAAGERRVRAENARNAPKNGAERGFFIT